mmetsp:Transcript_52616/g.171034  ORF Transcript_52616/g.171034 Transcript_52616/m.171034 type:complete len:364 (-) Transcript_52616:1253-2344(-)
MAEVASISGGGVRWSAGHQAQAPGRRRGCGLGPCPTVVCPMGADQVAQRAAGEGHVCTSLLPKHAEGVRRHIGGDARSACDRCGACRRCLAPAKGLQRPEFIESFQETWGGPSTALHCRSSPLGDEGRYRPNALARWRLPLRRGPVDHGRVGFASGHPMHLSDDPRRLGWMFRGRRGGDLRGQVGHPRSQGCAARGLPPRRGLLRDGRRRCGVGQRRSRGDRAGTSPLWRRPGLRNEVGAVPRRPAVAGHGLVARPLSPGGPRGHRPQRQRRSERHATSGLPAGALVQGLLEDARAVRQRGAGLELRRIQRAAAGAGAGCALQRGCEARRRRDDGCRPGLPARQRGRKGIGASHLFGPVWSIP